MTRISNVAKVLSVFLKYRKTDLSWSLLIENTRLPKGSLKYALDKLIERGIIKVIKRNSGTYYRLVDIDETTVSAFLPSDKALAFIGDLLKNPTTKYHYLFREQLSSYFLDAFANALFGTYCILRIERARDPLLLNSRKILSTARVECEYFFHTIFESIVKKLLKITIIYLCLNAR